MPVRFAMLASGSSGNAGWLQVDDFGLLIDAGLGPRLLTKRLADVGASWNQIDAVILTHTHTDHWKEKTLAFLCQRGTPLYCHPDHGNSFLRDSAAFAELRTKGLVRLYEYDQGRALSPVLHCRSLPLRHDDRPTSGFRFEISRNDSERPCSLAYLTDLGCWSKELAGALANVDVLALEFNHDVEMQHTSGRPPFLIARILGDEGHLSNAQAASLLEEIIDVSAAVRLRHLVQLHLSRHCNKPALAAQAAQAIRARCSGDFQIHTTKQYQVGPSLTLDGNGAAGFQDGLGKESRAGNSQNVCRPQPLLPGFLD
jgi:phosphoribosyl 1,2-cyclic phosphodiesterase